MSGKALAALGGRDLPAHAGREQAVRQAEISRLALALTRARQQLKDNRARLLAIVDDIAPGLTSRFGVGLVRMRSCPRTRAYVARRTAEGKTARGIRRCLKRYIARELSRQLTRTMNLPAGP